LRPAPALLCVDPGARSGNSCRSLQPSALSECASRSEPAALTHPRTRRAPVRAALFSWKVIAAQKERGRGLGSARHSGNPGVARPCSRRAPLDRRRPCGAGRWGDQWGGPGNVAARLTPRSASQGQVHKMAARGDPDAFHHHGSQHRSRRSGAHGCARDDRLSRFRKRPNATTPICCARRPSTFA
jgi:hypothetical protein